MQLFLTLLALFVCLALCWRYGGSYLVAVYDGRVRPLRSIERPIYKLLGTDPDAEQAWQRYAGSLVVFSGVSLLITYLFLVLQSHLPLNPQHLGGVAPALSFNTAVSFLTNTNWQNYGGETTMSYLSQMMGLDWQQFLSAAVGLALAIRGHPRVSEPVGSRPSATSGLT